MKTIRVAAAVIRDGDRVLATQRGHGEYKGLWEFPGGRIEGPETPEEALEREIREELDAGIRVGARVGTVEYDYPDFHLTMTCCWAEIVGGGWRLKEHEDARWLRSGELCRVDWLPADALLLDTGERALGGGSESER